MPLFNIPTRAGRDNDTTIAKKVNTKQKTSTPTIKGGGGVFGKITQANTIVARNLGKYKEEYLVIQDKSIYDNYIDKCILNGIISIDTETTGLDPIQDKIVGLCIYTPEMKPAYVPINHISYITDEKIKGQLPIEVIKDGMQRIKDTNIKVIMFNAKFDIRVIRNQIGVYLTCYWDCYLASRLLNENEPDKGLKKLHQKYVLNGIGDAFSFDEMFKGISFDKIPIQTAYLYAAHDAVITYELYEYQRPFLTADNEDCIRRGLQDVSWVFFNIEMPCVDIFADMEDTGIEFDSTYNDILNETYSKMLREKENELNEICKGYQKEIDSYKQSNPKCKLSTPINYNSPTQLAIFLYDILKVDIVDTHSPRGTGVDILAKINIPFTNVLSKYKKLQKLISAFITALPEYAKYDGRIHCNYNSIGADTGRVSCQNPNVQQIPSHNKDIRKSFKATDGYILMSADYSQQEVKVMAQMCGDEKMLQAFRDGKDFYAQIASLSFNKPYEECLEFRPDGTTNKAGKERRSQAKSILLG
jgi:DNA polymerase I-like protein with 3'-5' exonuclease and polymerase domains